MLTKLGNNPELFNKIQKLQDKALCIINFLLNTALVCEIYKTSKTLWLIAKCLKRENCFEMQLPQPLLNFFKKTTGQHNHLTCSATKNFAFVEKANSKLYGIESIRYQAVTIWKKLQNNSIWPNWTQQNEG